MFIDFLTAWYVSGILLYTFYVRLILTVHRLNLVPIFIKTRSLSRRIQSISTQTYRQRHLLLLLATK